MIKLGNGVLLEQDGRKFRFDPRRVTAEDVCMVSHAHTDHLPSSLRNRRVVCSAVTADFIKARRGKDAEVFSDDSVHALEAGHIPGSKMFLVEGSKKVLYTGDFCTRDKEHLERARPRKCDILITEATYGKPGYVFPDHREIMAAAHDWLSDLVRGGTSAVLFAYPLGKSQELCSRLKDLPLAMHPVIAQNNGILQRHGFDLSTRVLEGERPSGPVVYITSGFGSDRARVGSMVKRGAKTAAFSGWALDRGFGRSSGVNEAFPLSDHCGFDELMRFVKQCGPETVFTTHGFAKELALRIRKELGIDAQPLVMRQRTLDHFC